MVHRPGCQAAPLAAVWLVIGLLVVGAANLWPLDLVPSGAWPSRLAEMVHQSPDLGSIRALGVWLVLGALAAVAFAPVQSWRRRILGALGIASVAFVIEGVQVVAASRHGSLIDGAMAAAAGSLPMLVWRPRHTSAARWLWALAGLALVAILVVLPALGVKAATRIPFTNWTEGYPLMAGAEGDGTRAWQGEITHLTIYARPMSRDALALLSSLQRPISDAQLAGQWTDATTITPDATPQLPRELLAPAETAALIGSIKGAGGFTAIMTVSSGASFQTGDPRILTLSPDPYRRNVTIGQQGADLYLRVRTPWSGTNGLRQGLTVWPNVFAAPGPRTIALSFDGTEANAFVDGQPAGGPNRLYRPRLDLRHDGPVGDLALVLLVCAATGALAAVVAPGVAGWISAAVLLPGLGVQAVLALTNGSAWTACLVATGLLAAWAGMWLTMSLARNVRQDGRWRHGTAEGGTA